MSKLDPNTLFFGNWVDASTRLEDLGRFLEATSGVYRKELSWFEEHGHVDLDIEYVPLFADTLPDLLYTSVVISAASLLEQEMRGIGNALHASLELPLSFNDLAGSVIERFRKYALGLAGLPMSAQDAVWQDVRSVYEIRNCLVHAGGDMRRFAGAQSVRGFELRHRITLEDAEHIILDEASARTILEVIMRFLEDCYRAALTRFPGHYGPGRTPP